MYPLLPFFLLSALGASTSALGLIEGAAESASSFLKLASGYFSDRFAKRKFPVLFGYALSSALRPLLGLATNWTQILGLRLADRVGKGIRSAPRDAMIADSVEPKRRGLAFGFHRAMDHTGAVLGPLLAFLLIYFFVADANNLTAEDYTMLFAAASVPALLAVLVIIFFVKDQESPKSKVQSPKSVEFSEFESTKPKTKFSGNFKRFLVVLGLFTLSNSSDMFLLKRAGEVGVSIAAIPLLWMFLHIVKVIVSLVGGDLSDRIGRKTLIFAGWILYAAVYAGFAFVTTEFAVWMLFLFYGVFFGLTEGAEKALVADLVPPERRGAAFGWYHLAFGLTVFPASFLMGKLWENYGFQTAFAVSAAISLVAAGSLLTVNTKANFDGDLQSEI